MHWSLIVLIIVAAVFLWAVMTGVCMGMMLNLEGWRHDDETLLALSLFFWWAVIPLLLFTKVVEFIAGKISGKKCSLQ